MSVLGPPVTVPGLLWGARGALHGVGAGDGCSRLRAARAAHALRELRLGAPCSPNQAHGETVGSILQVACSGSRGHVLSMRPGGKTVGHSCRSL